MSDRQPSHGNIVALQATLAEARAESTRLRIALERIATGDGCCMVQYRARDKITHAEHCLRFIARAALHPTAALHPPCCTGLAPECVAAGKCLHPPGERDLPPEMLDVLRDPHIPLAAEEDAINFAFARGGLPINEATALVLARGCRTCLASEHPYWHPADRPCPTSNTPPPHPPREAPEAPAALLEMAAEGYVHRSMLAAPPEKGTGADDEYAAGILARQPMKPIPPLNPPCGTCHGTRQLYDDSPNHELVGVCPICPPTPEAPR